VHPDENTFFDTVPLILHNHKISRDLYGGVAPEHNKMIGRPIYLLRVVALQERVKFPDFLLTFSDQTGRFPGCNLVLLEYQNWQTKIIFLI